MKKILSGIMAGVFLLFSTTLPVLAWGGPRGSPGALAHPGLEHPHGFSGMVVNRGFGHQDFGRFRGFHRGGLHHGFAEHRGFHNYGFDPQLGFGPNVVIVPPFSNFSEVIQPPVVVQQAPPVYVQPESPSSSGYWYYCQEPKGYYPYVTTCPGGWTTLVPPSTSSP